MATAVIMGVVKCIAGPFIGCLRGIFLPDQHGTCALLHKVNNQFQEFENRKYIDGDRFPGSVSSYSHADQGKWTDKISDVLPVGQIIWPGTHYSATYNIGIPFITRPFGQRQGMSIYQQLLIGVRALDIRVQQDRVVCYGSMLSHATSLVDAFNEIRLFLEKKINEIIILEIQTERGFSDPESFDDYLAKELGQLLIPQNDQVFSKSISELLLLPGRIICIWKPILYAHRVTKQDSPIWSGKYLKCDEIDTQMPLTRLDGNIDNLRARSLASSTNNFFYKVEHTLNPKTSTIWESLLIWPKHVNVLSRRINGYARHFLAKCHHDRILDRLQICSVDFVYDDFICACIGLNEARAIKLKENPPVILEVNPQTDVTDINEVTEETPKQISEETSVSKINPKESNNVDINNNNGSNHSAQCINTNESVSTTIAWGECRFIWIKPTTLNISHIEDYHCWQWVPHEWNPSDRSAAQLSEISSLHVSGDCKIDTLPQGVRYEVLFLVKILDWAFGWESPIQLRLILPDGRVQENQVILDLTLTNFPFLPVGNFVMTPDMKGAVKFSLEQLDNSTKGGMVVENVLIAPHFVDIIVPRDLSISSGECWRWSAFHSRFAKREIELAELKSVRNFKVSGQFDTGKLISGSTYRVGFIIVILSGATGWESLTKLSLVLPNGCSQQRIGSLKDILPADKTFKKVYVGEFKMSSSPKLVGKLGFSMENDNELQKSGMWIQMGFIEEHHH